MNFFEPAFFVFISLLIICYSFLRSARERALIILVFSYLFYAYWSWKYLPLILITTYIDFFCGKKIAQETKFKLFFLILGLSTNLLLLFSFKYFNFFMSSIGSSFVVNLLLPVGISFYTFQSMSYTLDVYNDKTKVETSLLNYCLYVSFFPQLVAGPIERAGHLIPQFKKLDHLKWQNLQEGFHLALFGFFKKLVIADNLSVIVDNYYSSISTYTSFDSLIAIYAYAFQIYFDFSSYTDIARGVAKIFGIDLVQNFKLPYLSSSLTEFWKRWHISLTDWFRDYVYYPLCFNRILRLNVLVVTFLVFLLSGFWHGASWTFVMWGIAHGTFLIIEALILHRFNFNQKYAKPLFILINFHIVSLFWILFRAKDIVEAKNVFAQLLIGNFSEITLVSFNEFYLIVLIVFAEILTAQFLAHPTFLSSRKTSVRWVSYVLILSMIGLLGNFAPKPYIYFQF